MTFGYCSDCYMPFGYDEGPPEGWELEDGRIVCHKCCVLDLQETVKKIIKEAIYEGRILGCNRSR